MSLGIGTVTMIVHAVAQRGDGRLEAQAIIRHAMQKAFGGLAAPAKLARGDFQVRHANGEIGLDDARIHPLLGDGVTDDGQPVAGLEQQTGGGRRLHRLKLREKRIGRLRLEISGGQVRRTEHGKNGGQQTGPLEFRKRKVHDESI